MMATMSWWKRLLGRGDGSPTANAASEAGMRAFEEGDYEGAILNLTAALENGGDKELHYYRGIASDMLGRTDDAIDDLSRCIDASPDHSRALFSRSLTYRNGDNWEAAYLDIERAYMIDSSDFRIVNAYAQFLAQSPIELHRNGELAVTVATNACSLTNWEDPICLTTLSTAYSELGNAEKADEFWRKAQQLGWFDYDPVPDEVREYFERTFAKRADEHGLVESVGGMGVWTITRGDQQLDSIIFTTGMSMRPMAVPMNSAASPFAEVCMYLPADWPTQPFLDDGTILWPWVWLRRIAHYPEEDNRWFPGSPSVFPVDGPLEPLGPDTNFTALLLAPGLFDLQGFHSHQGPLIQIITAIPIYTEEYDLANQEGGIAELFQRFQSAGVSPSLAPNRPNVALDT